MDLPDDPAHLPPQPPKAEYQADYGAIRTMAWIALGCAVLAVLVMLFNKSGIGSALDTPRIAPADVQSPILNENYGALGQPTQANAWSYDVLKWGALLTLLSVVLCVWHWVRASGISRVLLLGLLLAWVGWTIGGTLLSGDVSSQSSSVYSGYNDPYGAKTQAFPTGNGSGSRSSVGLLLLYGLGWCVILGLMMRREDQYMDFVEHKSHQVSEIRDLDWSAFRTSNFIAIVLFTLLPALFALAGEYAAELVYFVVMYLTFPAWLIVTPFTDYMEDFQLLLFAVWLVTFAVICLAHLRHPGPNKSCLLGCAEMVAIMFVWATTSHLTGGHPNAHAVPVFWVSLGMAIVGGILLSVPMSRIQIGSEKRSSDRAYLQVAPGVFAEPAGGFCGNCGQPVHARDGHCLHCGTALSSA